IRDGHVTGVQTCALPIFRAWRREIGRELKDSVLVQRFLFRNPARIDAMVKGARAHRELARVVIEYAMGTTRYIAARRQLLLRFQIGRASCREGVKVAVGV